LPMLRQLVLLRLSAPVCRLSPAILLQLSGNLLRVPQTLLWGLSREPHVQGMLRETLSQDRGTYK
jgi:hypothetical protein